MAIVAHSSPVNTPAGACEHGVDVHDKVTLEQFQCLKGKGHNYAIIRAEGPGCKLDPYTVDNIKNAWKAGLKEVDIYIFPSLDCPLSANAQMKRILSSLETAKAPFGRVWLDIEQSGSKWSVDHRVNRKWIREAVSSLTALLGGKKERVGIYTSKYGWSPVVGNWKGLSQHKLWYANYDSTSQLNDNLNGGFGGWAAGSGFMKQFNGDIKHCGVDLDFNIRRGANAQCYDYGLLAKGVPGPAPVFVQVESLVDEMTEAELSHEADEEAQAFAETEVEVEGEGEAQGEVEAEAEESAEVEGEAEAEAEGEAEVEGEHADLLAEAEAELSAEVPEFNAMIEQAGESELEAILLTLESSESRPILPAPAKEEPVVKGLTMVTYDQSKGAKGQNTVTIETMKKKPVKCDPKKQHAHCDCKLDGPSPFVPVVA